MASLPKGVFSVLQDLIERAPQKMNPDQWGKYLSPGRKLEKEGMTFPLRKDELDYSSLDQLLDEAERSMSPSELAQGLQDSRTLPQFKVAQGKARVSPLSPELDEEVKALIKQWRNPEDTWLMQNLNQYARGDVHAGRTLEGMGARDQGRGAEPFAAMRDMHTRSAAYLDEHPIPRYPKYRTKTDAKDLESYEELMTEWPGLDFEGSHFTPSTLSHSRSSVVRAPGGRTRVIDEIQSDPHQRVRDIRAYGVSPNVMNLTEAEEERLASILRMASVQPIDDDALAEYQDLVNRRVMLRRRWPQPGAIPYADSYGSLELRKNLLRAAEGDEDAIAIAPGRMQSARYQMKLKPGMKRFYDQELPKDLERLVRGYGGEGLENIEIPLKSRKTYTDWRPNPDKPGMMTRDLLAELRRSIQYKGAKLTPEMKQRIRRTGIPLFGASPLSVIAGEDEE